MRGLDRRRKTCGRATVCTLPLTFSLSRSYDETRTIREGDDRTKQLLVASREAKKRQRASERYYAIAETYVKIREKLRGGE